MNGNNELMVSTNDEHQLIDRVKQLLQASGGKRIVISLAGLPGSGKSFWSAKITASLNKQGIKSVCVPQDGYHMYRKQLDMLDNPVEAHIRRGAPFTFNAQAFLDLVKTIKTETENDIYAPSFDHALKDPVENDIHISLDVVVVIIEGNYVSLKDEIWNEIETYVDDTWFIDTDLQIIRDRLIKRHLELGICNSEQEAIERADGSDLINAKYILENSKPTLVKISNV